MRWRAMLTALLGAGFFGCAEMPAEAPKPALGCPNNVCPVEVTVLAGCRVQAPDPEPVHIPPGRWVIHWKLSKATPQQYDFTPKGIEFSAGPLASPHHGPRSFTMLDTNSGGIERKYKYTINITGGGEACSLDPYVINDP